MFFTMRWSCLPLGLLLLPALVWPMPMAAGQPEYAAAAPPSLPASPAASDAVTHRLAKRMDLEACIGHFDVHKNTIIRTGESQAIGGKYLQGLELDSIEECERLCCETEQCDVYIFERKAGGYCYLFECGPPENFHCKFTRHANYTSAVLTPPQQRHEQAAAGGAVGSTAKPQLPHIPSNNISQQEWELSNLKLRPEVRDNKANKLDAAQSPQLPAVQPASATAAHCGRFQFSCHSGECIAVYNACDGIPQCEDGSDEGPECNAISSMPTKVNSNSNNNNVETPKAIIGNQPQYQHVPPIQQQLVQAAQQTQQQQPVQSVVMGPPPPPPPPPPMVNNREDAAAWANRKMIANAQQQQQQQPAQPQTQGEILSADELNSHIFSHKGGLQVPNAQSPSQSQSQSQSQVQGQLTSNYNNNNAGQFGGMGGASLYGMSLPRTGIYVPPQQLQQPALQMPPSLAWPQPQLQQPAQLSQQSQPQQNSYNVLNAASAPLMPVKPLTANVAAVPAQPQPVQQAAPPQRVAQVAPQQHQVLLPVLNSAPVPGKAQSVDEEYEDYEEEKSTEAPKKKPRKHKKPKGKSHADDSPPAPLPVAVSPVHEQYKMIHENLALEFRDHDGHSERPGGAVLSLTMGLLVTAALAILIGCRMRTVSRRARRMGGKTPYSQEADFLVNGMYL